MLALFPAPAPLPTMGHPPRPADIETGGEGSGATCPELPILPLLLLATGMPLVPPAVIAAAVELVSLPRAVKDR